MQSFEKIAHVYGKYNIIQKKIIQKNLHLLKNRVLDLGCGSEGLCKYKEFEFYLGIDKSEKMLKINPCNTIAADFNTKECFEIIKKQNFDQLVSFSALQWAENLEFVFNEIKKLNKEFLLAIFTSSTFKTLHKFLNVKSPIYSKKEILYLSKILNPTNVEVLQYEMQFKTPKSLLEYIKYSGVTGNTRVNPVKIRKFLKEFPVNTLEFEVLMIHGII